MYSELYTIALAWLVGTPELSGWGLTLLRVTRIIILCVLFRYIAGPFLFRHISSRIRVRSVSPRSVRGLYFHTGRQIITVDRIGLSFHRPSEEGARRFSIQIEGVHIRVLKTVPKAARAPFISKRPSTMPALADFAPSPMAKRFWSLFSALFGLLDPYLRPIIRQITVTILRLVIRILPALTQAVDMEIDSAVVSFEDLEGAHMRLRGATLSTQVKFIHLEEVILSSGTTAAPSTPNAPKRFIQFRDWRNRFSSSLSRTWERAWGSAEGSAEVNLKINQIFSSSRTYKPTRRHATRPSYSTTSVPITEDIPDNELPPEDTLFLFPKGLDLSVSVQFIPKQGVVKDHSVKASLNLSEIRFNVDALITTFTLFKANHVPPPPDVPLEQTLLVEEEPKSPGLLSPVTPGLLSPMSPFIENFSASMKSSMRFGRSSQTTRIRQLRPRGQRSLLLRYLKSVDVTVTAIQLFQDGLPDPSLPSHRHTAVIRTIRAGVGLTDAKDGQWREHIAGLQVNDAGPDSYRLHLTIAECSIHRIYSDPDSSAPNTELRLLRTTGIALNVLIVSWPLPWHKSTSRFGGDPNEPLLAVRFDMQRVIFSEVLSVLSSFLSSQSRRSQTSESPTSPPKVRPQILQHVPRITLAISIGEVSGRLVCGKTRGQGSDEALAVTLDNGGLILTLDTTFQSGREAASDDGTSGIPMQMSSSLKVFAQPTFIRLFQWQNGDVKRRFSSIDAVAETIVSITELDFASNAITYGSLVQDPNQEVSLDSPSTMVDTDCVLDHAKIELWHPHVISTLRSILNTLAAGSPKDPSSPRVKVAAEPHPWSHTAQWAIGQVQVNMTSPDLNPNEDLGISRGLMLKTRVAGQFYYLHPLHAHRLQDQFTQTRARAKLYLPPALIMEAAAMTSVIPANNDPQMALRLSLWHTAVRSSVATPYSSDAGFGLADEPAELRQNEFLWITSCTLDLNSQRSEKNRPSGPMASHSSWQMVFTIPQIRGDINLSHLYSAILAVRTIQTMLPPKRSEIRPLTLQPRRPQVFLQINVNTMQILVTLSLQQKLFLRCNSLSATLTPVSPPYLKWAIMFLWVPSNQGQNTWDEMLRLREWSVGLPRKGSSAPITITAEGARLRIPHLFTLSTLILDLNVTAKCLRHLMHISSLANYCTFDQPGPEVPKRVPRLDIRLRRLTLEICDDPFEVKLGLIQRAGAEAARIRREREEAFDAKVSAIAAAERGEPPSGKSLHGYKFSAEHSVSVADAWSRLGQVHAVSWLARHKAFKDEQTRLEETIMRRLRGEHAFDSRADIPNVVLTNPIERVAPLLRFTMKGVSLIITPPSFALEKLPDFLHEHGDGLPRDTHFWLLVPLHLIISAKSAIITLRDYPLPLLHIPEESKKEGPAWRLETDLVIAEEEGLPSHVEWIECHILKPSMGTPGASPMTLSIPKTTMPVKTYANAEMSVLTGGSTEFSWGVSYHPAIQDVMRVIETITSPQKDPSPGPGFWDKIRLSLHWRLRISFKGEVHLHVKGSRDPYKVLGEGAGFALCWQGGPTLMFNHSNPDQEFIQVISERMLIVIPNFKSIEQATISRLSLHSSKGSSSEVLRHLAIRGARKFQKVCARFTSGVRWGVGVKLERSCGPSCEKCAPGESRKCRLFHFSPHYGVKLGHKDTVPAENTPEDSFNGFRSDFIHLSISLTSALHGITAGSSSNIFLSPKVFAHFWSWWALFNGSLSLPIKHGSLFPDTRPPSKKFGRHLATLKYRIAVENLFISHMYIDESKDSWSNGQTTCVGLKALIKHFSADMHQREQEVDVPGLIAGTTKRIRHKPFYAAEVVLKEVDLRVMTANFSESSGPHRSASAPLLGRADSTTWEDLGDFTETDWMPVDTTPDITFQQLAICPHFTFFKRRPLQGETTRFGSEDTHTCFLEKDQSVHEIQMGLVNDRISQLSHQLPLNDGSDATSIKTSNEAISAGDIWPMISLLEDYVTHLNILDAKARADEAPLSPGGPSYHLPKDSISPEDWAEFGNVYQVHCPKLFLTNSVRDCLVRYYKCSRARRGFEYHIATRAVKYIRDQAKTAQHGHTRSPSSPEAKTPNPAHAAASAFRRILTGEHESEDPEPLTTTPETEDDFDPLSGWSEGVSLDKAHFCLLLKPQVVMQSDTLGHSTCILAAVQSTIQTFLILDTENAEDPVNGRVMTRAYSSVNNLQVFAPSGNSSSSDGCVPLEVLMDLRCQSNDFVRLVPQTDATFHYDKFNRLRLRNSLTSISPTSSQSLDSFSRHLQHQTDLLDVEVPKFTVSAGDEHFEAISNVVTDLLLFSDEAEKVRANQLETLLFGFDFSDLEAVAGVVSDLQSRLRQTVELESLTNLRTEETDVRNRENLLKIKAQIFVLAEELNLIFDGIKLAQDKAVDVHNDQKSALRVRARSSEISWHMLKPHAKGLLAKLAVRGIDFSWLRRQDSSTVSHLLLTDLQAFDTSSRATWDEIVTKYDEPANHPLLKRGIFMEANWSVLAPVGGITVFEYFEMNVHPIRLQLDSRLGRKIMAYVWPSRRDHKISESARETLNSEPGLEIDDADDLESPVEMTDPSIVRNGSPTWTSQMSADPDKLNAQSIRRIGASRSFTDLREAAGWEGTPTLHRTKSSDVLQQPQPPEHSHELVRDKSLVRRKGRVDAIEMRSRSSQKSFILVKIPSLNILLSLAKEGSFVCRDARIETHDLLFRNRTLSFHELAGQFMPTDHSWKGWVKMALQQPLVDVTPLAFELWRKTKFIRGKKTDVDEHNSSDDEVPSTSRIATPATKSITRSLTMASRTTTSPSQTSANSQRRWPHVFRKNSASGSPKPSLPVKTDERGHDS